jgi:hypothetical protein
MPHSSLGSGGRLPRFYRVSQWLKDLRAAIRSGRGHFGILVFSICVIGLVLVGSGLGWALAGGLLAGAVAYVDHHLFFDE